MMTRPVRERWYEGGMRERMTVYMRGDKYIYKFNRAASCEFVKVGGSAHFVGLVPLTRSISIIVHSPTDVPHNLALILARHDNQQSTRGFLSPLADTSPFTAPRSSQGLALGIDC